MMRIGLIRVKKINPLTRKKKKKNQKYNHISVKNEFHYLSDKFSCKCNKILLKSYYL